jgi:hypothetical protein
MMAFLLLNDIFIINDVFPKVKSCSDMEQPFEKEN